MPEAFCGLETVRKKAPWTLCALWEKNLPTTSLQCSFSHREHRRTEFTKAHKDSGPSPDPSPGGKGSDHRDTPIRRISALCCPLLVSTIVLTFCDICMPEAFCEFEIVRKKGLSNLWVLWEKEKSFVRERTPQRFTRVSSHSEGAFYFSQIYTDEQNTQSLTETLSQPISQNLTANVS